MAADAEATMPYLIEEVKRQITADRKRAFQDRGAKLAAAHQKALDEARTDALYAWDASPISTARVCAELWSQIKDEDWSLVSVLRHFSWWPLRLWPFDKHYQYIGTQGGGGIGYNAPASVGAALANRKYGRFSVSIQDDGDLLFAPAVLWTAAHHRIPILSVMHNNRAYHEELMHVQRMANRHNRGIDRAGIGTKFRGPHFGFLKTRAEHGRLRRRPDYRSQGSRSGAEARDCGRQARRAGSAGRRDSTALRSARENTIVRVGCPVTVFALAVVSLSRPRASAVAECRSARQIRRCAGANVEAGKKIFNKYGCYECHGREGTGHDDGQTAHRPDPCRLKYSSPISATHSRDAALHGKSRDRPGTGRRLCIPASKGATPGNNARHIEVADISFRSAGRRSRLSRQFPNLPKHGSRTHLAHRFCYLLAAFAREHAHRQRPKFGRQLFRK